MFDAAGVPGLGYTPGYLDDGEQRDLLATVDAQPWLADLKRRVQHYGYRYDYLRRRVDADLYLGPLPGWVAPLASRLAVDGHVEREPDQLIVNEYLPGQGISPHVDCVPCFGPAVASLSLGSCCVLTMYGPDARAVPVPVLLEPGSLLVMSGAARYSWRHGIAGRLSDVVGGRRLPRGRRVSLTFRTVTLDGGR